MQEKESIMVVKCALKIPSLEIIFRLQSSDAEELPFQSAPQNHI